MPSSSGKSSRGSNSGSSGRSRRSSRSRSSSRRRGHSRFADEALDAMDGMDDGMDDLQEFPEGMQAHFMEGRPHVSPRPRSPSLSPNGRRRSSSSSRRRRQSPQGMIVKPFAGPAPAPALPVVPVAPVLPLMPVLPPIVPAGIAVPRRRRMIHASQIPCPFVLPDGTDLGAHPLHANVISSFQFTLLTPDFVDVSEDIDTFVFGDDFDTATAGMSTAQKETERITRWTVFQNTRLVPAVNTMLQGTGKQLDPLSPPQTAYSAHHHRGLTHCQFFALNLFTKETPGLSFYSALNRHLLQLTPSKRDVVLNTKPYNDEKKVFNVWFYLFLSGLHELIEPVPATHDDGTGRNPTVRLFRGLGVEESLRDVLWKPPNPGRSDVYTSLGFSSFSTSCDVACRFAGNFAFLPTASPTKSANVMIFEPSRGRISLPSLRTVSDVAVEDEYLMFPTFSVLIFEQERGSLASRIFGVECDWERVLANDIANAQAQGLDYSPTLARMPRSITWTGITDITGATSLEDMPGDSETSGGARKRRKTRHVRKTRGKSGKGHRRKTKKHRK